MHILSRALLTFGKSCAYVSDAIADTLWPVAQPYTGTSEDADTYRDAALLAEAEADREVFEPVTPAATAPAAHPAGAAPTPVAAPAGPSWWIDWATPAICDVLAEHMPTDDETSSCSDAADWRERVAPLIAERLETQPADPIRASADADARVAAALARLHNPTK